MTIHRRICPAGLKNNPNKNLTSIRYITVHCTGNYNPTAGAENHAKYVYGGTGGEQKSWHYTVDGKEIWQHFEDRQACWHAGDGGNGPGNNTSIGIEICVNDPAAFRNACENAAWLVAELLKKYQLDISRVVQHNKWSGKDCPKELRSGAWGVTWNGFLDMVRKQLEQGSVEPPTEPLGWPRVRLFTANECYRVGRAMTPGGIMVHSTGANNPRLSRYVGPDDGYLGANIHNNHWNIYHPEGRDIGPHAFIDDGKKVCRTCGGRQICCHAFIGKLENGAITTYQTLPWDMRGWHCGGAGNDTLIGFEICEDGLADRAYFDTVYREAVRLCVYLCRRYRISAEEVIDHAEGYKRGIASNHADAAHWFTRHGKSMNALRAEVKAGLGDSAARSASAA